MAKNKEVQKIAIVGTGVIGASWAAYYLSRGLDVIATDPAPNAEASLRKYVDEAWTLLSSTGLKPGASRDRLAFTADMKQALSKADLVQENGPERPDFKMKLFADMDEATPLDSLIASSSSGITPSVMQSKCKHPERIVVGHPFNPPHIIPLVEVVGGAKTSPEAIQRAMAFYASIGKGRNGAKPAMAPGRGPGWDPTLHGAPHGSTTRHDEGAWNSKHHARAEADRRRWSNARSGWALRRTASSRRE